MTTNMAANKQVLCSLVLFGLVEGSMIDSSSCGAMGSIAFKSLSCCQAELRSFSCMSFAVKFRFQLGFYAIKASSDIGQRQL